MKNCFLVVAKMDEGNAPFIVEVGLKYPNNYELVPGHAWIVSAPVESRAFDVAKDLGIVSGQGGIENASGIVVPTDGYWGYAHQDMWDLMDAPFRADAAIARFG